MQKGGRSLAHCIAMDCGTVPRHALGGIDLPGEAALDEAGGPEKATAKQYLWELALVGPFLLGSTEDGSFNNVAGR
jgi:hypothetical protein